MESSRWMPANSLFHCGLNGRGSLSRHHDTNVVTGPEPAKWSPRRNKSEQLRWRTERRHGSAGESYPPGRGAWPRTSHRHLSPNDIPGALRCRNRSEAARKGMEVRTPRRGETPRPSIRRVLDHQSRRRIAKTRSGIFTSPERSPSACECAAGSGGAHADASRRTAAACRQSLCDQPARSTAGPRVIDQCRRSGTHATKSPLRW